MTDPSARPRETPADYISRLLSLLDGRDPLDVLQSTATRLRELLANAAPGEIRRPREAGWNAGQIVAHLADSEVVAAYRVRTILATPGAPLVPFDQDVWADRLGYAAVDAWDALETFAVLRRDLLRLLRRVGPERWDEYGMHAERGKETIEHLTRLYAGHDLNHLAQVEALVGGHARTPFQPADVKPPVSLDACTALDVRVGTIRSVAPVPGADRLAALSVSFGADTRTIVAGIRTEREQPEEIVGRQALFLVNVPPRRMRGVLSEGMLFDIGYEDGVRPVLACPERPVPDGTRAG